MKLSLPLGRTAYQTNEQIDLCVVRSDAEALPAADLNLALATGDGSRIALVFPVAAAAGTQGSDGHGASAPERLAAASGSLQDYRVGPWRHCLDRDQRLWPPPPQHVQDDRLGQPRPGSRYGDPRRRRHGLQPALRRLPPARQHGQRPGHAPRRGRLHAVLHDVRGAPDGPPPGVRLVRPLRAQGGHGPRGAAAFMDRTKPNALGVHYYDEPGLTWESGTPHAVAAQLRAFKSASPPIAFRIRPSSPAMPPRRPSGSSGAAGKRASWRRPGKTPASPSTR